MCRIYPDTPSGLNKVMAIGEDMSITDIAREGQ
jgi:hypothetical protein